MTASEILLFVLLDVAVVVAAARVFGWAFQRMGQPAVVGEIVAGITLGPSLLGLLPGDLHLVLFPTEVRPYLNVIAQIGLILFMFVVGLEVDLSAVRRRRGTAVAVSLTSIALPFGLGMLLALALHGGHSTVTDAEGTTAPVDLLPFALFLGVAMSITAFPVLARILTERGLHRTGVGALALTCAAVDDVLAWSLLAVVVAVGSAAGDPWQVVQILGLTAAFALVVLLVVRPLAGWIGLTPGKTGPRERAVIAFFGVRGVGSLFYIAYALQHGDFPGAEQLWAVTGLVVVGSIVIHGVAATPVMDALDRRRERLGRRRGGDQLAVATTPV